MTTDEIRAALWDRNLSRVAEATGIHHNTLIAIRKNLCDGGTKQVSEGTRQVLSAYLMGGNNA